MKKKPIYISEITISKLRSGKLIKELPEFYELKKVVEINPWHDHENVFDHTLSVMKLLLAAQKKLGRKGKELLKRKIGRHSRGELLFLAALLHDIAKGDAISMADGMTRCFDHEALGAKKARKILERFDLSANEMDFVARIVGAHGDIHAIPEPKNDMKAMLISFRKLHKDDFLELVLLGCADTSGSYLRISDPEKFKFRKKFYKGLLDRYD